MFGATGETGATGITGATGETGVTGEFPGPKCEVIIVKYGSPVLETECINSVIEHTTDVDYSLTVYDNYEDDEALSKVWNDLIRISDAEYICLLNNDTRVEKYWLSSLLECFELDKKIGAVGPVTNHASGLQGNYSKYKDRGRFLFSNAPLVGFCLVFPRFLWREVGGFDEEYAIYGEDSDFCMMIRERGFKWMIRTDVFIYHHGKSSTPIAIARGKDVDALKEASKNRFREKWRKKKATWRAERKKTQKAARQLTGNSEAIFEAKKRIHLKQANTKRKAAVAEKKKRRADKMLEHQDRVKEDRKREESLSKQQKRRVGFLEWKARQLAKQKRNKK